MCDFFSGAAANVTKASSPVEASKRELPRVCPAEHVVAANSRPAEHGPTGGESEANASIPEPTAECSRSVSCDTRGAALQ